MTEKEAINYYKKAMQIHKDEFGEDQKAVDLYNTTINALQELKQYREIGTIDDFQRLNYLSKRYEDETYDFCGEYGTEECELKNQIEQLREYEAIGTVEECREARERQMAKKPLIKSKYKTKIQTGDYVYIKCPCCGEDIFSCFYYLPWNDAQKSHEHCKNCGQTIDWSE